MEQTSSKYRSLIGIIIFLLISNIAILVFFLFLDNSRRPVRNGEHNAISNFLQKDIGFNKQQLDDYQLLRDSNRVKIRPRMEELREAKDSFYNMLYNDVPDSNVNKLAALIGEKQMQVDMQFFQHFKNVRKLCTPAQLPKFDSLFRKEVERMTGGHFRRQDHNHDKKEK